MTTARASLLAALGAAALLVTSAPAGAASGTAEEPRSASQECVAAQAALEANESGEVAGILSDLAADEAAAAADLKTVRAELDAQAVVVGDLEVVAEQAAAAADEAQTVLGHAQDSGDADAIAAAETALAQAEGVAERAAEDLAVAVEEQEALADLVAEIEAEVQQLAELQDAVTDAIADRGVLSEADLQAMLAELRSLGLDTTADLLEDVADACFSFRADEDESDEDDQDAAPAPARAPVATPVTARATFTG